MESPSTWKKVHYLIGECLFRHDQQIKERRCGLSLQSLIVNALKEAGYLTKEAFEPQEKKEEK